MKLRKPWGLFSTLTKTDDGTLTFLPSKNYCYCRRQQRSHSEIFLSSNPSKSTPLSLLFSNVYLSFDRYRTSLKGTWKDEARAATGITYDLGTHLIDQSLVLFGLPDKITGFIQNLRGLGSSDVDDWVCGLILWDPLVGFLYYDVDALLTVSSRSTFII